ncbi:MAG: SMC-Scp complex subunit ScpB [Thermoleophilia bacterium]|nr:SMC-Scp complex subunit ScpB [Thermoleophilia bacterium]
MRNDASPAGATEDAAWRRPALSDGQGFVVQRPAEEPTGPSSLRRDLEALLFAAGRPLGAADLTRAASHSAPASQAEVEAVLATLEADYSVDGLHGFELARVAEGWLFRTNRAAEPALAALFDVTEESRLSTAALETLAIVAYSQPVSRPQIAEIRGVSSDSAVQTLVERGLIQEVGRQEGSGGAVTYGTTERFQVVFGLDGLDELPPLEGFAPSDEERAEIRRRLGLVIAPD